MSDWKKLKKKYYGKDYVTQYKKGIINFNPDSMNDIKNGIFKSYNEYLNVQMKSCDYSRKYFEICYYHTDLSYNFKGQIDHFNTSKSTVLFSRIMINGLYSDGTGFYGKEDHVWMDIKPFKDYAPGDFLQFSAEIGRYMKQKNGKLIDFELQNPLNITRIDSYEVPTDNELIHQQIDQLVCETCRYYDHCFLGNCISNETERNERIETLKSLEPGKFTPLTVMLAYELEYRMLLQTGGFILDENDKNYHVMKRFIEICEAHPVYYTGDVNEAIIRMTHPDKPRLYIETPERK